MSHWKIDERLAEIRHKGITVDRLREFVAECDAVEIPGNIRVQFTGQDHDGTLRACHRITTPRHGCESTERATPTLHDPTTERATPTLHDPQPPTCG